MRVSKFALLWAGLLALAPAAFAPLSAQAPEKALQRVADRLPGEGEGPYPRLIIRGAMVIEGSGATIYVDGMWFKPRLDDTPAGNLAGTASNAPLPEAELIDERLLLDDTPAP